MQTGSTLRPLAASIAFVTLITTAAAQAASPSAEVTSDGAGGFRLTPAGLDTWTTEVEPGGTFVRAVTQDTVNLEYALASAAPGATVHLGAGDFRVSRQIPVPSFQGRLEGEGAARSRILAHGENGVFPELTPAEAAKFMPPRFATVLFFYEEPARGPSRFRMSDLAIHTTGRGADSVLGGMTEQFVWAQVMIAGDTPNYDPCSDFKVPDGEATIEAVSFSGEGHNQAIAIFVVGGHHWFEGGGLNGWGEWFHQPFAAQIRIRDCRFEELSLGGMLIEGLYSPPATADSAANYAAWECLEPAQAAVPSPLIFSANAKPALLEVTGNRFDRVGTSANFLHFGVGAVYQSGGRTTIRDNRFSGGRGDAVIFFNDPGVLVGGNEPAAFEVSDNHVDVPASAAETYTAIEGYDFGFFYGLSTVAADVSDNKITTDPGNFTISWFDYTPGAVGFYGAFLTDPAVTGNRVTGAGTSAIDLFACDGAVVTDNALRSFDAALELYRLMGTTNSVLDAARAKVFNDSDLDGVEDEGGGNLFGR